MSFTLDGGLTFRRVSFSDSAADKGEEYEHAFDAKFCVMTGTVRLMLADLVQCLGGLAVVG
jgi:DNA recombination-dependent growth factor C